MRADFSASGLLVRWLGGPIIWAVHFLSVYASESLICTRGVRNSHFVLVTAITAVAVVTLIAMIVGWMKVDAYSKPRASGGVFMDKIALGLSLASMVAVFWTALPAMFIPACLAPLG